MPLFKPRRPSMEAPLPPLPPHNSDPYRPQNHHHYSASPPPGGPLHRINAAADNMPSPSMHSMIYGSTTSLNSSMDGSGMAPATMGRKSKLERLTGEEMPMHANGSAGGVGMGLPPHEQQRPRTTSRGMGLASLLGGLGGGDRNRKNSLGMSNGGAPASYSSTSVATSNLEKLYGVRPEHRTRSNTHANAGGASAGSTNGARRYTDSPPHFSPSAPAQPVAGGGAAGAGAGDNYTLRSSTSSRSQSTGRGQGYDSPHQHQRYNGGAQSPTSGGNGGGVPPATPPKTSMLMLSDAPEEADCPVCLEPLSLRLAGEKPHVVPQCGHALHNACFTAVYGAPESVLAAQKRNAQRAAAGSARGTGASGSGSTAGSGSSAGTASGKSGYTAIQSPGMCGVCRKPIVLGTAPNRSDRRIAKATGLMGIHSNDDDEDPFAPRGASQQRAADVDDRVEPISQTNGSANGSGGGGGMVIPIIRARPEYPTLYRRDPTGRQTKQSVVCVVSVEVPARRSTNELEENFASHPSHMAAPPLMRIEDQDVYEDDEEGAYNEHGSGYARSNAHGSDPAYENAHYTGGMVSAYDAPLPPLPLSGVPEEGPSMHYSSDAQDDRGTPVDEEPGFSYGATLSADAAKQDPYKAATEDLRERVIDWKGHTLEHFGPLHLYDSLNVRQDTVVREFSVYLFQEALLCVSEERRRGLGKLVAAVAEESKPGLKLKGRIYIRHIKSVRESSVAGEPSLSIKMDDEHLDQFVLCFDTEAQALTWRRRLEELVDYIRNPSKSLSFASASGGAPIIKAQHEPVMHADETESERARLSAAALAAAARRGDDGSSAGHNGRPVVNRPRQGSINSGKAGSTGDAASVADSHGTRRSQHRNSGRPSGGGTSRRSSVLSQKHIVPLHQQWSASGGHNPNKAPPELLTHAPLDLIIMISVPLVVEMTSGASAVSSSAALKLRLIRSSLEFIVNNLRQHDRICLVSYSVGLDGQVRKTQLLKPSIHSSRERLMQFIEGMGSNAAGASDPFVEDLGKLGGSSDRIDTVTALNVGLDVVLQRTTKNPTTGMLLINDTSSSPKRQQVDLVMARAEAANVPIHCFGYGKNHDPSSLWLISNQTRGSYTFVKEWFQLRECLTGCIGCLTSIALTDVKVHISLPSDNRFRVRKISGVIGSILSANGKDVDIELGYVHFGEVREFFVELEVDFAELMAQFAPPPSSNAALRKSNSASRGGRGAAVDESSATDDFMARMGIAGLDLDADASADHLEAMATSFIEELVLLSVDSGFRDPSTMRSVTRMINPTVLTIEVDSAGQDPTLAHDNASGAEQAALVASLADPTVTRRRIEILASEMITRSLLLVSKASHAQAQRVLAETRRVVETVVNAIPVSASDATARSSQYERSGPSASNGNPRFGGPRRQRELMHAQTLESLHAILDDLDQLLDCLEQHTHRASAGNGTSTGSSIGHGTNVGAGPAPSISSHSSISTHNMLSSSSVSTTFEREAKNFGAQQAMILRDQKAWTTRTNTEYLRFARDDNGSAFAARAYVHSLPLGR